MGLSILLFLLERVHDTGTVCEVYSIIQEYNNGKRSQLRSES